MHARGIFGRRLSEFRDELGMTREHLESIAAVPAGYISRIESGRRWPPRPDVIHRLCEAMGQLEHVAYWQRLAGWDRMLRHLPAEAFHGRATLERIGHAFAAGEMPGETWRKVGEIIETKGEPHA